MKRLTIFAFLLLGAYAVAQTPRDVDFTASDAAEQKCLDLLPNDSSQNNQFKQTLREAAEGKVAKVKGASSGQ